MSRSSTASCGRPCSAPGSRRTTRAGEKFDPEWHEALSTQPTEGAEAGTIVETLQKGYRIDGQVLRPARVVVAG